MRAAKPLGQIGHYTLGPQLGSGGYGTVHEAYDRRSRELVALKRLVSTNPRAIFRFKREFRALQGVYHPNLVALRELFEFEGSWFIAMDLIDGPDLLTWVRSARHEDNAGPRRDEVRIRRALHDMAVGLLALHEHGVLHRDLKPSNVRVTREGRAVLLDFGLVTPVDPSGQSMEHGTRGTLAYMAPEQIEGTKVGPAADWYALGACLYEALTGQLPFAGDNLFRLLSSKMREHPRPPSRLAHGVPRDLDELCIRLLNPDASVRPAGAEVAAALALPGDSVMYGARRRLPLETFAGRESELQLLSQTLGEVRAGELRVVVIEGESGVGKSALVEEFLQRELASDSQLLTLRGRCYENELVPFKAFDGCMEDLANALGDPKASQSAQLPPARLAALAQLLPMLQAVPMFASASAETVAATSADELSADPTARRLEAFSALRDMLAGLSRDTPVVLVLEDIQWADADSFRMLRALLDGRTTVPMLFLITVRPSNELEPAVRAELTRMQTLRCVEMIRLRGLPRQSTEGLVRALFGAAANDAQLEAIAAESDGLPMFIGELVQYVFEHGQTEPEKLTLAMALGGRIRSLHEDARVLLELMTVSDRPYPRPLFMAALGWAEHRVRDAATTLLAQRLSRSRGGRDLSCFHDHIRQVVKSLIPEAKLPELHRQLATALVQLAEGDLAEEARHWELAGEPEKAARAYELAADESLESLAFMHAAAQYARALDIVGANDPSRVTTLRTRRGHALARAGCSALAAQQYLDACEHATEAQRIELRVWAAQHLLQSGQVEAGLAAARDVLAQLGAPLPTSEMRAIARIMLDRVALALRGYELSPAKAHVDAAEYARLAAMWSLQYPISVVDVLAGAALGVRHLRSSLAVSDPLHVARALGTAALGSAIDKPDASEHFGALFARARALYDAQTNPALEAWILLNEASAAIVRSEMVPASEKLARAEALLRAHCPDDPWLLTNVRRSLVSSWFNIGRLGAKEPTVERWLAEAAERDDRFALASFETLGLCSLRFLLADEPQQLRDKVRDVLSTWPREPFGLVHLGELGVLQYEAMYRGGDAAWRLLESERARHRRAFLFKTTYGKVTLLSLRAQAGLSAYFSAGSGPLKATYLEAARTAVSALSRSPTPFARLNSPGLQAQLAIVDGQHERALSLIRTVRLDVEKLGYALLAAPLRYVEGGLEGGDLGREKQQSALAVAAEQGWKNPQRYVATWFPAINSLFTKSSR